MCDCPSFKSLMEAYEHANNINKKNEEIIKSNQTIIEINETLFNERLSIITTMLDESVRERDKLKLTIKEYENRVRRLHNVIH